MKIQEDLDWKVKVLEKKIEKMEKGLVLEDKAEKLYEIIKLIFATPDNINEIEKIWRR